MAEAATNLREFTVGELAGAIRRSLEEGFGLVRLRGEISGWRGPHASGHCYFSIKDADAKIDAVIWRGTFARMKTKPEEGVEVVATGRITAYASKSSYQIVVESIEPAGVGALLAMLEARRKKLAAEGLFDEARKRSLPAMPRVVGVVTSPTGSVIRDILHRISERFPLRVLVWPARVQGEGSAEEVAAGIAGFNALPADGPIPRPDVLIVARGGGSLEDLMGFSEEIVVRAAAASAIPLIAAVGHETDWTLIDYAADVRAPTPTAAAEMATPVRSQLAADVAALGARALVAVRGATAKRRGDWRALVRALPTAERLLAAPRQNLDRAATRLSGALQRALAKRSAAVAEAFRRLARKSPLRSLAEARGRERALGQRLTAAARRSVERKRERLTQLDLRLAAGARRQATRRTELAGGVGALEKRLATAGAAHVQRARARLEAVAKLFAAVSYRSVLARGFALVKDETGEPLRLAAQVAAGQALVLEFADGEIGARAAGEASPPKRAPRPKPSGGQGDLF